MGVIKVQTAKVTFTVIAIDAVR